MKFSVTTQADRFMNKVMTHLERRYPDVLWETPPEKMQQLVQMAIARARQYNFHTDAHIVAFIEHCVEAGDELELPQLGAQRILENPALSPDGKLQALTVLLYE